MKKSMKDDKKENMMPRLMIAAASSGSGKTVMTCGLLEVLKRRGHDVRSFKCGPDYIDPMFHRTVLGISAQNLDAYLAGEETVKRLVAEAYEPDDAGGCRKISVIEGVMGIYDGTSPASDAGSCYEIARITDTPVILIVNASGAGRTVISIIKGILSDDSSCLIKGIILNMMSDGYYEKMLPYISDEIRKIRSDVTIIGHVKKDVKMRLESRHLGLVLPEDANDIKERISAAADLIEEGCDTDALIGIAKSAGMIRAGRGPSIPRVRSDRDITLAVARDEAFCFYYRENLALFEELGARIVYFSPLHDEKIPEGACGLLLGGGYPELFLKSLSANTSMLSSVKEAIESGIPSLAECGGFMYLHRRIKSMEGKEYETVGAIDGECSFTGHLVNFGYAEITGCSSECSFSTALTGMRGHEFHCYDSTMPGEDAVLLSPSSGKKRNAMTVLENRLWGFLHLYYPSDPQAIAVFAEEMRKYGNS